MLEFYFAKKNCDQYIEKLSMKIWNYPRKKNILVYSKKNIKNLQYLNLIIIFSILS